jgi:acid phosphatase
LVSIYAKSNPNPNIVITSNTFPSVQWIGSAEYNLLCIQIYNTAKQNFIKLDLNNTNSVMIEQERDSILPPAIIVDIDETILLNLAFRKETTNKAGKFSYAIWEKHLKLKTAIPVNGSLDYLQYLSQHNVKIIYISNRDIKEENETFELLMALGYPIKDKGDLLLKNEKPQWTKDKTSRRSDIGKKYKIIQIFGDNLRDFTATNKEAFSHKNKFGKDWFLLPNPIYGNWKK